MDPLIRNLILANLGFYSLYTLSSGPKKIRRARLLTVQPESSFVSLFTFHFANT